MQWEVGYAVGSDRRFGEPAGVQMKFERETVDLTVGALTWTLLGIATGGGRSAPSSSSLAAGLASLESSSDAPRGGDALGASVGVDGGDDKTESAGVPLVAALPEDMPTFRRALDGFAFSICSLFRSAAARIRSCEWISNVRRMRWKWGERRNGTTAIDQAHLPLLGLGKEGSLLFSFLRFSPCLDLA